MPQRPSPARVALVAALVLALSVPLVFVPGAWYPFVVPRALVVHAAATVGLAGLALDRPSRARSASPVALAVLLWIASAAAATAVSVEPARSLRGTPARMQGLITLASVAVLFFVARRVLGDAADRRRLLAGIVAATTLASGLGVLQALGVTSIAQALPGRAVGTLGNPVYLAGIGVQLVFLGAAAAAWSRRPFARVLAGIAALTGAGAVLVSETRGALLGLAAGLAVAFVAALPALREHPRRRRALIVGAVALGALGAAAWAARDTAVVQRLPLVRRLADVSATGGSGGVRVAAWRAARAAAAEHPLLGWGPECFQHAADVHYPENFALVSAEPDLDDAHSAGLQALVTCGAAGAAAYLALVCAPLWTLLRRRDRGRLAALPAAALLGLLVGWFVHGLLAPQDVAGMVCWVFALALVDADGAERAPAARRETGRLLRAGVAIAAAAVLAWAVVLPGAANLRRGAALAKVRAGAPAALDAYERARLPGVPRAADFAVSFAESVTRVLPRLVDAGRSDEARTWSRVAAGELEESPPAAQPLARTEITAAVLAYRRAALLHDATGLPAAVRRAARAHAQLPRRPDLAFALADLRVIAGDAAGAIAAARAGRDAAPRVTAAWCRLAAVHDAVGDAAGAAEVLAAARRSAR